MTHDTRPEPGRQKQDSRQSGRQGSDQGGTGKADDAKSRAGIGSSQGQDRSSPRERDEGRPSAGTPDVERGGEGGDVERAIGPRESLVQDPTGAFKERP